MIKVGVADCGLSGYDGGMFDYIQRVKDIQSIGYNGIERLYAQSAEEAINISAELRMQKADYATCLGPTISQSIRYTSALGREYVWASVNVNKLWDLGVLPFDLYLRGVNKQVDICKKYGISVAVHNHLGQFVETEENLEKYLKECPEAKVVLDTAHLHGAGGDPMGVIEKYIDRIAAIHVKDYVLLDENNEDWIKRLRFCELGAGVMSEMNADIVKAAIERGYDGWVFVEQDTHMQDPLIDLKISREYLKKVGI